MVYNLTSLQNATNYPSTLLSLDNATGNVFVMGLLILINIILFMVTYRSSGLKSAVVASVFPVAFFAALLYPLQLISQGFFMLYVTLGLISLFILFQNR